MKDAMGSINRDNLSRQALIEKLRLIIDTEINKPYEVMDDALVAECADFLMELEKKEKLSDEEIKRRVREIPSLSAQAVKRRRSRKSAIAAACFAAVLIVFGAAAAAHFDGGSLVRLWAHKISEMLNGETLNYSGISIVKSDMNAKYDSVEEMLANESRDILYPTVLPNSASITAVYAVNDSTQKQLFYAADDTRITVAVDFGQPLPEYAAQGRCTAERIGALDCFIISEDSYCQGVFLYGEDLYTVTAASYDDLVLIIHNLKEN